MPNIQSAKKRVKVIETKTLRNKRIKSALKTMIKKYEETVGQGNADAAKVELVELTKRLDQAVAKGIYHKSTISRKKSRLTKLLNSLSA